jgi:hypothetical protein
MSKPFSDAVRRFVLINVPTVPHMEALLLLWRERGIEWSADEIARRLFVAPARAAILANELCDAGLLDCHGEPKRYRCRHEPASLCSLLAEVDAAYSRHLRQVTELIHSDLDRKSVVSLAR